MQYFTENCKTFTNNIRNKFCLKMNNPSFIEIIICESIFQKIISSNITFVIVSPINQYNILIFYIINELSDIRYLNTYFI